MIIAGISASMMRSGIKSAISLAAVSIFLSIILFILNCPFAALFELSVCSGLITVVFISTVSMTTKDLESKATAAYRKRFTALPFILLFTGIALIAIIVLTNFDISPVSDIPIAEHSFKDVFWNTRQADILGQIIVVLAGAFAIVALFKGSDKA